MPAENGLQTPEALTKPTTDTAPKTAFYKKPKFIIGVIGILVLIGAVLWLVNVFSVYSKAKVYKKAYDTYESEMKYCDEVRTQKESQNVFNYCDLLSEKFKGVERGK
jgi:uncharacterized Fe-S radical SAM superfamily protein PflX